MDLTLVNPQYDDYDDGAPLLTQENFESVERQFDEYVSKTYNEINVLSNEIEDLKRQLAAEKMRNSVSANIIEQLKKDYVNLERANERMPQFDVATQTLDEEPPIMVDTSTSTDDVTTVTTITQTDEPTTMASLSTSMRQPMKLTNFIPLREKKFTTSKPKRRRRAGFVVRFGGGACVSHPVSNVRSMMGRMHGVSVIHAHGLPDGAVYLRLKNREMIKRVVDAVDVFKEIGVSFVWGD
jgi:hypothetical protein